MKTFVCAILASIVCTASAFGQTTIDFDTVAGGGPLDNGQAINDTVILPDVVFSFVASDDHLEAAIFDSTPDGPNQDSLDWDLLVDTGNVLILQNEDYPEQSIGEIYDTPNDSALGGTLTVRFMHEGGVRALNIRVIDIDEDEKMTFIMTDTDGNTLQTETDLGLTGNGGQALFDFPGVELGDDFDPNHVVAIDIVLDGSGAVDDLTFSTGTGMCEDDIDCDDDIFCNGQEMCIEGECFPGKNPCPGQTCDEDEQVCNEGECNADAQCDDGTLCTADTCDDGVCNSTVIPGCDDCSNPGLFLTSESLPIMSAEPLVVDIMMSCSEEPIVGAQFFLLYDVQALTLIDLQVGEFPFDIEIFENVDPVNGLIDYAVHVPFAPPHPGDTGPIRLATAVFSATNDCGTTTVHWRRNNPPTRLSTAGGGEIQPELVDLNIRVLCPPEPESPNTDDNISLTEQDLTQPPLKKVRRNRVPSQRDGRSGRRPRTR